MTYTLHNPVGEPCKVTTLDEAYGVCRLFRRFAESVQPKFETMETENSNIVKVLDQISMHWNNNVAVIKRMEADPAIALQEAKARCRLAVENILDATKNFEEK